MVEIESIAITVKRIVRRFMLVLSCKTSSITCPPPSDSLSETDRIGGIVWHPERFNPDVPDRKRLAASKDFAARDIPEEGYLLAGTFRHVECGSQCPLDRRYSRHMIPMAVG